MKTFFEKHIWPIKGKLYRLTYLWVKDREVAQDILQTVFEKTLRNESDVCKLKNPVGWVVASLKNESLQHHRGIKRMSGLGDLDLVDPGSPNEEVDPRIEQVFRFVQSLPEMHREVFHLREVEGLTYEEIGDYLDISLDQVKVSLFRARRKLRDLLLKETDER
ncbi:RNA polymerase sigma factor [Lunatibacter salilacus]|uniref:RNA polymerase sigma factor n=1 Tax=Lunatibacter salilacus TaxID=2483804 RepID=UPI00131DBC5B|nr:RNA polymerase sigma factor [Lunatibacter salilacus]